MRESAWHGHNYDRLAGRTETEACEWHVFMLFLVHCHGWHPQAAAGHTEWLLQRPFQSVSDWMGDDKWRKAQCMRPIPEAVKKSRCLNSADSNPHRSTWGRFSGL